MRMRPLIGGLLALIGSAQATPPPGALLLGPTWRDQPVQAWGTVIAQADHCRELAVDQLGVPGAGGRLWVCARQPLPNLGQRLHVNGRVGGTRLTRVGAAWRVVPVVNLPNR